MEFSEIESLLKIAEHESITQTAETLHMSQQPLTRQLQRSEAELGVSLFTREKKRLHITDDGFFSNNPNSYNDKNIYIFKFCLFLCLSVLL